MPGPGYPRRVITLDPHPLLALRAFTTAFPTPVGQTPSALGSLLGPGPGPEGITPSSDTLRAAIRDLLRHGGFKPTGRSKPASEYLVKAAEGGFLGSINLAVDACNVVSLHSGFPISVVDLDRVRLPLRIGLADAGASYVFNATGQAIDIGGLLCLHDADGPCANAVKDAQRTKTTPETTRTLSVLWGVRGFEPALDDACAWYQGALTAAGAAVEDVPFDR